MANPQTDILGPDNISYSNKIALPNATASLVLGILSLVLCIGYGIMGVILGGIGYYLSQKDKRLLDLNPDLYSADSVSSHKAGRTCALIGLILGGLFLLGIIIVIIFIGIGVSGLF